MPDRPSGPRPQAARPRPQAPGPEPDDVDVAVIGAGAAGLATGIFLARRVPRLQVAVVDGARTPGAKILVSGGGRCNVTNARVEAPDFSGGSRAAIGRVLRAWPVRETVTFFETLGVSLHEEADGKLFPDSGRARDVLDALLGTLADSGAHLVAGCRVTSLARAEPGFVLDTGTGPMRARAVVLATGGLALPKSGSDGAGYGFARALGHTLVPTTPALVPLVLAGESRTLATTLTGVAEPVRLAVRVDGRQRTSIAGALLWTHFGISGPAVLDASRHWLRARLEGTTPTLSANLLPGQTFESAEAAWTEAARGHGRTLVRTHLARDVPGSVAAALAERLGVPADLPLARLARTDRRALLHGLLDLPLDVSDSRGYRHAEVTAGGIALDEFDPGTLESRRCPGLYAVGEVLDVDGRLGGFNFQWAWSSARVAADALARRLA